MHNAVLFKALTTLSLCQSYKPWCPDAQCCSRACVSVPRMPDACSWSPPPPTSCSPQQQCGQTTPLQKGWKVDWNASFQSNKQTNKQTKTTTTTTTTTKHNKIALWLPVYVDKTIFELIRFGRPQSDRLLVDMLCPVNCEGQTRVK